MGFKNDPGLLLYLPFYELYGSSFMSRDAYGHLCAVTGAVLEPGRGRRLDGDDYITIPDHAAFDITTMLSALVWVNPDAIPASNQVILSKYNAAGDKREWAIITNNGKLKIFFGDPNDGTFEGSQISDGAQLSAGTWALVGFSFNAGTVVIYANGSAVDSSLDSGAIPASLHNDTQDITVAAFGGPSSFLTGKIGEVWLYGRVLLPQEGQHNYLTTKWRYR